MKLVKSAPYIHYLRSILILSSHLRLGLPSGLFTSGFSKNVVCISFSHIREICSACFVILFFSTFITFGEE
jgi:hypothetical protein